MEVKIKSALISVFHKDGLDDIIHKLHELGVDIYTTGGTQTFIESLGIPVARVEDVTGYPSILDGRVKTLHPKIFGGILGIRNVEHLDQLNKYEIPPIDLVLVDLYPFEATVESSNAEKEIIEKIDIGGISLIRAAAKNFNDVVVIPSKSQYVDLLNILNEQNGTTTLGQRRHLAAEAFKISSHYDSAIFKYMASVDQQSSTFKQSILQSEVLRYGENPHQNASFFGDLSVVFDKLCGKELSYNNLVDIDAAIQLMREFKDAAPTFAILKHTNACGIATSNTISEAWDKALAADPVSAFGGILISNSQIDITVAEKINKLFYEVLIAPSFSQEAYNLLASKPNRVLLALKQYFVQDKSYKSLLNGAILQDTDLNTEVQSSFELRTKKSPNDSEIEDLEFAIKCAKHLKSNTIVLVKNKQLLGMGCGQTSRIDACRYAIEKAKQYGFDLKGAVMASDAFFPFPDCVALVHDEGINAVVQPGGSIKDQLSVDFCDEVGMPMVFTGVRHFKH